MTSVIEWDLTSNTTQNTWIYIMAQQQISTEYF